MRIVTMKKDIERKKAENLETANNLSCGCNGDKAELQKPKDNWYLSYMDKKAKGIEVGQKNSPVTIIATESIFD
jgi:hypothetical protein